MSLRSGLKSVNVIFVCVLHELLILTLSLFSFSLEVTVLLSQDNEQQLNNNTQLNVRFESKLVKELQN